MFNRSYQFFGLAGLTFSAFALICWGVIAYDDYHLIPTHFALAALSFLMFALTGGLTAIFSRTGRKTLRYRLKNSVYVALFVAALTVFNMLATRYELFYLDTTEQSIYTLAPQSTQVLENLKAKLTIKVFAPGGVVEIKTQNLLNRLAQQSEQVSWEIIDPERNPTQAERFAITEANTVLFEYHREPAPGSRKLTGEINEQNVINSILMLSSSGPRKAYFLSGHNEPDLTSLTKEGYRFFAEALEGENFIVDTLLIEQDKKLPETIDLLIVAAPKSELLDFESETLKHYIDQGGKLLLLHEPATSSATTKLARHIGIEIGNNLIVDSVVQLFSAPGFGLEPVVSSYSNHPIVRGFNEKTYFSSVSSVSRSSQDDESISIIARTSEVSWAETDLELLLSEAAEAAKEDQDIHGPVPIGVAWEKGKGRAVVFGDADFAANIHFRKAGNRDLILNSVSWIVGESEGITLRPRTLRGSTEPISSEQTNKMFIATAIFFPEIVLLFGLVIWWRRKNRTSKGSKEELN